MTNANHYTEMFDYLSAAEAPTAESGLVVFGRKDERVAQAAGSLVMDGLARYIIITGGFGKDSGDLQARGFSSEAHYLDEELYRDAIHNNYASCLPAVYLEEAARNGGENARNSLSVMEEQDLSRASVTAVVHATSLRRLAATLEREANGSIGHLYRVPSEYPFSAENPSDQNEAVGEILRLHRYADKGWATEQPDMPQHLLEFALDVEAKQATA